ncbi:SDR family oxidoreductase [Bordetella bronchiseptica]|uniref:SDR family oxidoreductase n=1 Tax=Bordetella bronchiseptica TaxID=518 RepID=UPI00028B7A8B|nr:SDR family oxidoreductase [Bordetella bronchiseptica]AUL15879.1 NDP-sugar oxidoreductase [Bordetella bronchiseptica]AWP58983.1 NDP-sugar oxidoreductase [Bordetella bronchiseptica]KAK50657.1 NAD(P)H-binding protein, PF13460 family [Bordetella bronchiseptica OSU054]KAK71524.1 NAD(P)H-binding protein, PF13460 family [Bordetella bronchiseptica CA90 BB02]KCV57004.1 NAD(P)H-binding protein, PF13460 family [Bordetella bronchiseptica 7E71]
MRVLITGANGYIGRALAERLCALSGVPGHGALEQLTLCDLAFDAAPADPRVRQVAGDFADPATLAAVTDPPPDLVFHLACVASGRAELEFELGLRVNLEGSLRLLEQLRRQGRSPGLVFTSSIAVYGAPLPALVTDDTPLAPALSYGAQKQAVEILLADYTRRGFVRGRAVRLPGVAPRPPAPNGAWSAFSSTLLRALAAGQPCEMPVGPQATLWLMSLPCCVDNLLRAAELTAQAPPPGGRTGWTLPALRVSVRDIVQAFDARSQGAATPLVSYAPRPDIEAQFGNQPPLQCDAAQAAGFRHDGSLSALLERAVGPPP